MIFHYEDIGDVSYRRGPVQLRGIVTSVVTVNPGRPEVFLAFATDLQHYDMAKMFGGPDSVLVPVPDKDVLMYASSYVQPGMDMSNVTHQFYRSSSERIWGNPSSPASISIARGLAYATMMRLERTFPPGGSFHTDSIPQDRFFGRIQYL